MANFLFLNLSPKIGVRIVFEIFLNDEEYALYAAVNAMAYTI
jgi:hypothetical protein